ncbi:MAG TPA: polysaccharide biosynthesis/export family protein [Pyrinomonadaceae bacterium]|jgi:polysaccharide export outer membrane protein
MKQINLFKYPAQPGQILIGTVIFLTISIVLLSKEACAQEVVKTGGDIVKIQENPAINKESVINKESEQYLIGSGDVLDIRIYNRPQLSRDSVRVDGRGRIQLPLIGEVQASCLTESDLAKAITKPFLEYLRNPHVEVFIKEYQSKPVMVIGAVRDAGQFQLRRRVRILELLSLAGGLTDQADGRIQVKHAPEMQTCGEAGGETENAASGEWYNIADLLRQSENAGQIPYVQPGDTINLLEADKAFIVGNVVKPSTLLLKERITITEAVASAGGVLPDSKLDKVRILRQNGENDKIKQEIIVDLKAINKLQAEDIALQANDIVDVPTSNGKKFLRGVINNIAPTISRGTVRIIP